MIGCISQPLATHFVSCEAALVPSKSLIRLCGDNILLCTIVKHKRSSQDVSEFTPLEAAMLIEMHSDGLRANTQTGRESALL